MRLLIGCPVRRNPAVLDLFLGGLGALDLTGVEPSWLFVDDCDESAASQMLRQWTPPCGTAFIHRPRAASASPYVCDDGGHRWAPEHWWRVAAFKDRMLGEARHGFDGCFLIDSDLLLQPATLQALIGCGKDIAVEVFWTRTRNRAARPGEAAEYPNVWAGGDARWWLKYPGESFPDPAEALRRADEWIVALRRPGLHRIGGGGACTLFGRRALDEPRLCFAQLNSVDYHGEDRALAVRAEVLGLEIWADTTCPPVHLYWPEDVAAWMRTRGAAL